MSVNSDDFVVNDEVSGADGISESELDPRSKKSKYKTEKASKGSKLKGVVATPNGPQGFLLTAAEQRAREKKTDKVEKEEAFSFLLDIRDVIVALPFSSSNMHSDDAF